MKNKMIKKIIIENGKESNDKVQDGKFIVVGNTSHEYKFPFTSSSYTKEKKYYRGLNQYEQLGIIRLNVQMLKGLSMENTFEELGMENTSDSRRIWGNTWRRYFEKLGDVIREKIQSESSILNKHLIDRIRKQTPPDLVRLIKENDFEVMTEPIVNLGYPSNDRYAIYGYNCVIKSPQLFDTDIEIN